MSGATFLSIAVHAFYGTLRILWAEVLHIVFIASRFAGLFYLSRVFVNLAMETERAAITRLLVIARKPSRLTTILAVVVILPGLRSFLGYRIGLYPPNSWMHAKFVLVLVTIGYHHGCGVLLRKFEAGTSKRSHKFCRWFNELPALLSLAITILVVVESS